MVWYKVCRVVMKTNAGTEWYSQLYVCVCRAVLMWWMAAGCLGVWQLGGRSCCRTLQSWSWCSSTWWQRVKLSVGGILHDGRCTMPCRVLCSDALQFLNHTVMQPARTLSNVSVEGGKVVEDWLSSVSTGIGGIAVPSWMQSWCWETRWGRRWCSHQ